MRTFFSPLNQNRKWYSQTFIQPKCLFNLEWNVSAVRKPQDIEFSHIFYTICPLGVWQGDWQRAAAAADMCLTCTLTLVDIWRQPCRRLSEQSGDAGLVGIASLSHIQYGISRRTSVGVFTPPPPELWYSADLEANNRPFRRLSLLQPSHPLPPLPPFYLGQSLM